ncbi:uncharacterized protein LOC135142142 [Zophobas morio]|uniref:uncharacterized protein LOC135142142 n=1 Tax=Zophobas morio TaxID=2755281 RepID=UPI0030828270
MFRRNATLNVSPPEIIVILEDENTHCEKITLFNPYPVALKYDVYTNIESKFKIEKKGLPVIKARSSTQVYIRCVNPVAEDCNVENSFFITLTDISTEEIVLQTCIRGVVRSCGEKQVTKNRKQTCDKTEKTQKATKRDLEVFACEIGHQERDESPSKPVEEVDNQAQENTCRPASCKLYLLLCAIVLFLLAINCLPKSRPSQEISVRERWFFYVTWQVQVTCLVGFISTFYFKYEILMIKTSLTKFFSEPET